MTTVQIRDVPEPILHMLKDTAAKQGRSLSRYLLEVVTEQGEIALTNSLLEEAAAHTAQSQTTNFDSVAEVAKARSERDNDLTAKYHRG